MKSIIVQNRGIFCGMFGLLAVCLSALDAEAEDPAGQNPPTQNHAAQNPPARPIAAKPAKESAQAVTKSKANTAPEVVSPPPAPSTVSGTDSQPNSISAGGSDFQPVVHARGANIATCMDNIVTQSARVLGGSHTALSSWVTQAPNEHLFGSIVGLSFPNKTAPNGVALILAAPMNANACEGESVQIYPTTQSCGAIQASLIQNGRTLGALQALPVVQTNDGARNVLVPTAGNGCVIVSVRMAQR